MGEVSSHNKANRNSCAVCFGVGASIFYMDREGDLWTPGEFFIGSDGTSDGSILNFSELRPVSE